MPAAPQAIPVYISRIVGKLKNGDIDLILPSQAMTHVVAMVVDFLFARWYQPEK